MALGARGMPASNTANVAQQEEGLALPAQNALQNVDFRQLYEHLRKEYYKPTVGCGPSTRAPAPQNGSGNSSNIRLARLAHVEKAALVSIACMLYHLAVEHVVAPKSCFCSFITLCNACIVAETCYTQNTKWPQQGVAAFTRENCEG